MDRILLGKREFNTDGDKYSAGIAAYVPSGAPLPGLGIAEGQNGTVTVSVEDTTTFQNGDTVIFPPIQPGLYEQSRTIGEVTVLSENTVRFNVTGLVHSGGQFLTVSSSPSRDDAINYWSTNSLKLVNESETERRNQTDYGLFVSKSTSNVLDTFTAKTGNLSFDSSLSTLRIIQTGTFQIQCKKTFMGKKGALEIGSDEQLRANADYTKRYPFELDTLSDDDYYATLPKNANTALYGFGEGEVPFTGNAINHQYVQNVYCDYGTQTIEFFPPLPSHIKTPYVSVFFAVGNSSGHFHPWYANVTCDDSDPDYTWQYANSQHCVHMDSAWFRGKWTFRERTIAPLGTDVNLSFPSVYDMKDQTYNIDNIEDESQGGTLQDVGPAPNYINWHVGNNVGISEPGVAYGFGSEGQGHRPGPLQEPAIKDYPYKFGELTSLEFHLSNTVNRHHNISYNMGDTDLNSPSSLWGGMMKSFAGLQGVSYFANNTHLKIDGFMTPTHTPTPFETEIVKERIVNPDSGSGGGNITNTDWHPNAGSNFDKYGNFRKNVGLFAGVDEHDYESIQNNAFANGFGFPYKEKLPRKFRTKYWDGSQTEYEWWPIGHANGHFTIAYATNSGGDKLEDAGRDTLKAMLQAEATAMHNQGLINSASVQYGTVGDTAGTEHPYLAAAYGDYSIIKEQGADKTHWGTPFLTAVNKGTRFPNQLSDTEAKGYPPNSQYEPGDAFLKTRTFQGQPTSLDSFWNSFSNNRSQWVSSNTPYGEFYYADGGYAMDHSPYFNYGGGRNLYAAEKSSVSSGGNKFIKIVPSDWNIQRQSFQKHNWNGGNPKAGVGTEGRRFGFGGAGSAEALGGEGEGVFDTYYGKYIVYDIEGGDVDA